MKSKKAIERELAALQKEAKDSEDFGAIQQTLCWVLSRNVMSPVRYALIGTSKEGAR